MKTLLLVIMLMPAAASAKDCVPGFYVRLPRDRSWHYAVGVGDNPAAARSAAMSNLVASVASTSQHDNIPAEIFTGIEQDDAAECDGKAYIMVRIEKAVAAKAISDYYATRQDMVDKL